MFSDLRLAFRSLAKSPGYTVVALFTLALGIGVNTSMFSVVNTLLFKTAPYPDSGGIVLLDSQTRGNEESRAFSVIELEEIRAQTSAFSSLTVHGFTPASWTEPGRPAERLTGMLLSNDLADTYRTPPAIGRTFTAEEFQPGKNLVVLLSDSFWRGRLASDPNVIGRTLRLDGEMVTVIGVMPPSFEYKLMWGPVAFWRPLNFTPDQIKNRTYRAFVLIGRLKSGATPASALAELTPLAQRLQKDFPQEYSNLRYRLRVLHEASMDSVGRAISWMLLGLSGFVLLIACANLANLQLARATSALRDFAIRAALGASRGRLILQQLVECVVLSLGGGVLGIIVGLWINRALERSILIGGETSLQIALDVRVLAAGLLVSLLAGVLFGIVPALFASRTDVATTLKSQSRGSTGGKGHQRLRQAVIVGEVALALVLLGGAAIMNRGFNRLLSRQVGWDTSRIAIASLPIPESRFDTPEKRIELYRRVEERVARIPGAERAAISTGMPIFGYFADRAVFVDEANLGKSDNPTASHVMISSDYFATLGIPLREGRIFERNIQNEGPQYAIVNESLARRFWPNESAVGKRIASVDGNNVAWREVVGVVADIEASANIVNPATRFVMYRPFAQEPWSFANILIRSENPGALIDTLRRAIADVESDLPVGEIGTVRQITDQAQHNLVVIARVLAGFAVLGLLLAAVGLYGVISHTVAQRTPEFGIRMALGAQPRDVMHHVLSGGLSFTGLGLGLGLVGAWGLGAFLESFMPRLASTDPVGLLAVAGLLLVVSLIASFIPARRATRVDPVIALRSE